MENNITVLKFSATWCGPCKMLAATLNGVEGITNVDIDQQRDLAIEYNVKSVPTLVFLQDGKEVERKTGLMSVGQYQEIINRLNNK
jgi:thioredoxin 1